MTGTKKCLYSYKNNMKRYKIEHLTSRHEVREDLRFTQSDLTTESGTIITRKLSTMLSTYTLCLTKSREVEATSTGMTISILFSLITKEQNEAKLTH